MHRLGKRLLLVVPVVLLGGYATAICLAYKRPPLSVGGWVSLRPVDAYVMAVDLRNDARWPVSLSESYIEGDGAAKVTAVVSLVPPNSTVFYLASSASLMPEGHPYREGNVVGWHVTPTHPGTDLHGIRLELPLDTAPTSKTLVVNYRYLGWPFTVRRNLGWPWTASNR